MTDFETELTELLEARAQRVTVSPDPALSSLDQTMVESNVVPLRQPTPPSRSGPARAGAAPWFAAAAAVFAVIGGVFLLTRGGSSDIDVAAPGVDVPAAIEDSRTELEGGLRSLIVWMEADATAEQLAVVEATLAASGFVESVTFIDQETSYAEFEAYWADSPEILAAVTEEQLPTSFQVVLAEPLDVELAVVAAEFDGLSGVMDVDYDRDVRPVDVVDDSVDDGVDDSAVRSVTIEFADDLTDDQYRTIEDTIRALTEPMALSDYEDIPGGLRVATSQPLAFAYNIRMVPGVGRVAVDPSWSRGPLFLLPSAPAPLDGLQGFVSNDLVTGSVGQSGPSELVAVGRPTETGFDKLMSLALLPALEFDPSETRVIGDREILILAENVAAEATDDGQWLHFYVNDLDRELDDLVAATTVADGKITFSPYADIVELTRAGDVVALGVSVAVVPEPGTVEGSSWSTVAQDVDIALASLAVANDAVERVEVRGRVGYRVLAPDDGEGAGEAVVWWEPTGHMVYVTTAAPGNAVPLVESMQAVDEQTWRAAVPELTASD